MVYNVYEFDRDRDPSTGVGIATFRTYARATAKNGAKNVEHKKNAFTFICMTHDNIHLQQSCAVNTLLSFTSLYLNLN